MNINDVAVIGMGPSGVTAGIYLKRFGFEPVCFEYQLIGGKMNFTYEIENYPGYIGSGMALANQFADQVKSFELNVVKEKVLRITKEDDLFKVITKNGEYLFKAVVVCAGMVEKEYVVPGQEGYGKRGISRCAICDGPLFRHRPVAVVGGGNSAFEEAIYLSSICESVTLINRRVEFRADQRLVDSFKSLSNTKILAPYVITDSKGSDKIEKLTLENVTDKSLVELDIDALFVYVGATPILDFISIPTLDLERGFIKTDSMMKTNIDGLYACGDNRVTPLRQIATACSDGAIASLSVKKFLRGE